MIKFILLLSLIYLWIGDFIVYSPVLTRSATTGNNNVFDPISYNQGANFEEVDYDPNCYTKCMNEMGNAIPEPESQCIFSCGGNPFLRR